MKRFPFIQAALMATLVVIAASCTMPREASGGYYEDDAPARRNGYYGSPYGSNVIVLERDPYTGQYYEVAPYGSSIYANPYGYYSGPYNNGYYGRGYSRRRGGYSYSTPQNNNNNNTQTQAQRQEAQRQLGDAKGAILGPKKRN